MHVSECMCVICLLEYGSTVAEAASRKAIGTSRWTIACLNGVTRNETVIQMYGKEIGHMKLNAGRKGHLPVSVPAQCSDIEPILQPCSHPWVSESTFDRR